MKVLIYISAILSEGVLGWGLDGHAIVAEIAERLLSQKTKSKALDIVRNASLASISDWADEYRHSPEGKWSGSLHYADLPDRVCEFDPTRDCISSRCVYGAIMNYTHRVQAYQGDMDLKFLVHLVGDAHQPLHAGFTGDRGGNEIHVTADFHRNNAYAESPTAEGAQQRDVNLHAVWDDLLLGESEEELKLEHPNHHNWHKKADALFQKIDNATVAEIKTQCECPFNCALQILKESARLACDSAYHLNAADWMKSGDHLSREYYESRITVIDKQLIKAGVRLAVLIETALSGTNESSDTDEIFVLDA